MRLHPLLALLLFLSMPAYGQQGYVPEVVKSCPDASAATPVCPTGAYTFAATDKNATWVCRNQSACTFTFPVMVNGWFVTVGAEDTSTVTLVSTAAFDNSVIQINAGEKLTIQADDTGNFLEFTGAQGPGGPLGPTGPAGPSVTITQGTGISVTGGPPNPYVISTTGSPPPPPPPPPGTSPDCTLLTAPTGQLTDGLGNIWTWGATAGNGEYYILENGTNTNGWSQQLTIKAGVIYAIVGGTQYYIWNNPGWGGTSNPGC